MPQELDNVPLFLHLGLTISCCWDPLCLQQWSPRAHAYISWALE